MSTRLRKKLPIARPLDKGNLSYGNEINRRRPDSTCVQTSLSFFHCACVQTSLFYPLGMCFRSRAFRRLFFSTAHPYRRLIFFRCTCAQMYLFSFPLCIRSVVSLLWKAEKKGRGCSLGGDAWQPPSKPCLKFQTKLCDLPYLSTATIDKKKEHTWFQSLVTGSTKPSPSIGPKRLKSSQTFRTNMFIIVGHHTEFGFNGFIRKAVSSLESFPSSEKHM